MHHAGKILPVDSDQPPHMQKKVLRMKNLLEQDSTIWQLKDVVRRQFCSDIKVLEGNLKARVDKLIRQSDYSKELENQIYHLSRDKPPRKDAPGKREKGGENGWGREEGGDEDPVGVVQEARVQWEDGLNKELQEIAKERGEPLARPRPPGEHDTGDVENGNSRIPVHFLFDSVDLLEALGSIEGDTGDDPEHPHWGMIKMEMETPSLKELQHMYSELDPANRHMGLDDKLEGSSERFLNQRVAVGNKVQQRAFVPLVRQYAKFGIPPSLRPSLWRLMLGLPVEADNAQERATFARLQEDVTRYKLVTDELLHIDVQNMADDHRYFPFEEVLENVILAFSRDSYVRRHSAVLVHKPLLGHECGDQAKGVSVPPCAIMPFRGFISYAAPVCFMYEAPEPVYFVARALWCQVWCKLNAIRSTPGHLFHLCKTFEDLLLRHHPRLFFHLLRCGVNPLQLSMPWIELGFVGYLEVDQVLLLWDRLLGYDSLFLLPALAAAVIIFRAQALSAATDLAQVQDILGDGSRLKVTPLLQAFLFPHGSIAKPQPPSTARQQST